MTALLTFVGILTSCGTGSSFENSVSDDEDSTSGDSYQSAVGGQIEALSINNNSATLDLSADTGSDVMLAFYSYDTGSTSHSFQISAQSGSGSLVKTLELDANQDETEDEADFDGDLTGDFHLMLREYESALQGDVAQVSTIQYATKELSTGDQKTFRVLNSFSGSGNNYTTVTATLRYETEYFEFYVDDRDASSMDDADLAVLAEDFVDVIPIERDVFGTESDVNGDGKFAVLFTEEVNKLGASQGGIVTGFFYAIDLFESAKYPASNQMEVLFTFVPDPKGKHGTAISKSFALKNILKGVLPHEYQHMINYNQHALVNGGAAEAGWLNEGLSHLAEDFYTMDGDDVIQGFGLENPSRVSSYLANVYNICFTCGTSLSQRGGVYLFLKYLYEQAGLGRYSNVTSGNDMLTALLDTSERGIGNVVAALYGENQDEDKFMDLMGQFSLALYLSNTEKTDDARYGFSGLNLRSVVSDNRGTVLDGPIVQSAATFPFIDSLSGSSISYVQIPADLASKAGGVLKVTTSDSNVGAFLVR